MNFLNYTEAAPSIYFEPAARDQRDCSAASEHEQINSRRAPGAHLVGREQVQVPPQGWARGRPLAVGAGDPERRDPGGGGRSHRATRRRTGEGRRDDRVGVSCGGGSRAGFTKPAGTGPVTAVTGLTGPDRFRFRPVLNRPKPKFKF